MGGCTHCDGYGFLNLDQIPAAVLAEDWGTNPDVVLKWIEENEGHDVVVCNCCGDGESWYGERGSHYSSDDPPGPHGPYAYNGGLCECH